jgi:hypothetical protein
MATFKKAARYALNGLKQERERARGYLASTLQTNGSHSLPLHLAWQIAPLLQQQTLQAGCVPTVSQHICSSTLLLYKQFRISSPTPYMLGAVHFNYAATSSASACM